MRGLLIVVFLSLLVIAAACAREDAGVNEGNSAVVQELVKANCASCHGGSLDTVPGSHLSLTELEKLIVEGRGNMPAIDVTEKEARQIAEYLINK